MLLDIVDKNKLWDLLMQEGDLIIGNYRYKASIDNNQIQPTSIIIEYKDNITNKVIWLR